MRLSVAPLFILILLIGFSSCKKDDDGTVVEVEINDRTEQQVIDNDSIVDYLNSNYYNAGELASLGSSAGIQDIIISDTKVDDGYELLMDSDDIVKKSVTYEDTEYEYYVIELNLGGGSGSPTFADSVQILYEGSLLDNTIFDFKYFPSLDNIDLAGVVPGWRRVIPNFNVAEGFTSDEDGTINYFNSGLGIMFLPSGLGYFSNATTLISSYSPLIFKFELLKYFENDHDGDGLPSYFEDLNGDGEFYLNTDEDTLDGDDTDDNGFQNFVDADDDGDGVSTFNELESKTYTIDTNENEQEPVLGVNEFEYSRSDNDGIITLNTVTVKDSNNDDIGDYLDADIIINYNE